MKGTKNSKKNLVFFALLVSFDVWLFYFNLWSKFIQSIRRRKLCVENVHSKLLFFWFSFVVAVSLRDKKENIQINKGLDFQLFISFVAKSNIFFTHTIRHRTRKKVSFNENNTF